MNSHMQSELYLKFFHQTVQPHRVQSAAQHFHLSAGVPIKAPVAGISCGLITGDEGVYVTL